MKKILRVLSACFCFVSPVIFYTIMSIFSIGAIEGAILYLSISLVCWHYWFQTGHLAGLSEGISYTKVINDRWQNVFKNNLGDIPFFEGSSDFIEE